MSSDNPFAHAHQPAAPVAHPPADIASSVPGPTPAAGLVGDDEINGILSHLSVELRTKANSLSDHTYNVMELQVRGRPLQKRGPPCLTFVFVQNKLRSLEQAFAAERAARTAAEAAAKAEYERAYLFP